MSQHGMVYDVSLVISFLRTEISFDSLFTHEILLSLGDYFLFSHRRFEAWHEMSLVKTKRTASFVYLSFHVAS